MGGTKGVGAGERVYEERNTPRSRVIVTGCKDWVLGADSISLHPLHPSSSREMAVNDQTHAEVDTISFQLNGSEAFQNAITTTGWEFHVTLIALNLCN